MLAPSGGHIRVCAAYPNHYELAMSSLGFQYLYAKLNGESEFFVERVFLPEKKAEKLIMSKYLPSFETSTPLVNFNVIAFTLSYETDFINVLKMLKMARIPVRAKDRLGDDYPLIICGGPAALQNIIPIAEVFDVFALGSGEITIPEFAHAYCDILKNSGAKKIRDAHRLLVERLSARNNFLCGGRLLNMNGETMVKVGLAAVPDFASSVILTPDTNFSSRALIEVQRGCVRRCRFCMVGNCYGKFRHASFEKIASYVEAASVHTKKFGLMGPAVSSHPDIEKLYSFFKDRGFDVSMSSVYIEEMSRDALELVAGNSQRNITAGIESADYEIRKLAGKALSEEALFQSFARAAGCGFKNFKIYLILGLYDYFGKDPGREASDTAEFIERAAAFLKNCSSDCTVRASINPLVIKPRTPFFDGAGAAPGFFERYRSASYIEELEYRYKSIQASLKSFSNVEFSEKSFSEAKLLKLITDCKLNLFDFFDDFFYNESHSARRVTKIMEDFQKGSAFDIFEVRNKLFQVEFREEQ